MGGRERGRDVGICEKAEVCQFRKRRAMRTVHNEMTLLASEKYVKRQQPLSQHWQERTSSLLARGPDGAPK